MNTPRNNNPKPETRPLIFKIKEYLFTDYDYRINIISNHLERKHKEKGEWELVPMNDLSVELYEYGLKGFSEILKALFGSSTIPKYDPFVTYFEDLSPWDPTQEDYIKKLASYVKTDDGEWFELMLRKWLVRYVGQAIGRDMFNKQCLTLVGKQNDGKTTFLDYLVPPALKNYTRKGFDFGSNDGKRSLVQNLFINLDELASFEKKELNNEFKSVLSEKIVKFRPLFQDIEVPHQRRASFVASTNHYEFLTDETGNVRWLAFVVHKIAHDNGGPNGYMSVDIDRVLAQAYYLLNDPEFKYDMLL